MSRSVSASEEGVIRLQTAKGLFQNSEYSRLTYGKIAGKLFISEKTVARFFTGKSVEQATALAIIEFLGIKPEEVLCSEDLLIDQSIKKIRDTSTGTPARAEGLISEISTALDELNAKKENSLPAM